MRWIVPALLSLLAQSAAPPAATPPGATPSNLPPAYPRPGATKILDSDRVQVWNIAWLKGQPSPLHRHIYDLVGVYYEPGDRMIISPEGARRPVSTKAWDIAFQRKDVTHIEEGVSDAPLRAVFVEMKQPGPYDAETSGSGTAAGDAPAFPGDSATQRLDNDRVTVWEFTRMPSSRRHRHTHDAVAVEIDGQHPRATWIARGTVHSGEAAAPDGSKTVSRLYVFELK
jgi:hypothetical protein